MEQLDEIVAQINATNEVRATITKLSQALLDAKTRENIARQARISLETKLAKLVASKPEGSATTTVDDWKITVTNGTNYRVDWDLFDMAVDHIPMGFRPVSIKRELNVKQLKHLEQHHPDMYACLIPSITTKPKKVAVKVEEVSK